MTHRTHFAPRWEHLAGLVFAATLGLGLAGCATPGKAGAGAGEPVLPSASSDGAGLIGLPGAGGTDGGTPTVAPPPPTVAPSLTLAPPPIPPAPEDCVSFNPSNLSVAALGDAWILRDGSHNMLLFDTKTDADDGLKVARNWTRLCFIGRGNTEEDRYRYIVTYWKNPSGLPLGLAPTFDCITYNPAQLTIYSGAAHPALPEQDDWALYSGSIPLLFLSSEPDAQRAKIVASGHTKLCFIGHGNDRPDPYRYQMEYWRQ